MKLIATGNLLVFVGFYYPNLFNIPWSWHTTYQPTNQQQQQNIAKPLRKNEKKNKKIYDRRKIGKLVKNKR